MKKKSRILVIIPTYNESMNVKVITPLVLAVDPRIEILFIDDNSPDGTAAILHAMIKRNKRIHILERPGKLGLGTAYVTGFQYALEHGYDYVFEMDADLSHDPKYLAAMIHTVEHEADVVVGSRYIHGVSVAHWPLKRLLLSKLANVYASFFTGVKVRDLTAGFVGYRNTVLADIDVASVRSSGYAFQIELKYRCHKQGYSIKEIPIIFADRERGESKISKGIIFEALHRCISLRWTYRPRRKK
ncbi:MAG TPA: polyprenol monophosphomannose synthase [Spirochaetota bacterium]|nr:polyprenol monophosphomannose synthase [Spirochaetota bacterium]HPH02486.1 polyprenol monophosphomannose synthase [Spirochaetota bacterium]